MLLELQALNMLSFSRHAQLASVVTPDASAALQAKLALHAARTLALPMGRGALTLSTVYLLPTEPLQAYNIVLDGVSPHDYLSWIVVVLFGYVRCPGLLSILPMEHATDNCSSSGMNSSILNG
jgi:hypothetical protein